MPVPALSTRKAQQESRSSAVVFDSRAEIRDEALGRMSKWISRARMSGMLTCNVQDGVEFLYAFWRSRGQFNPEADYMWIQALLSTNKHRITNTDIVLIAKRLMSGKHAEEKAVGKRLLDGMASLGDPYALLSLFFGIMRRIVILKAVDPSLFRSQPFLNFIDLATSGNWAAMVILGRIEQERGDIDAAREMYEMAIEKLEAIERGEQKPFYMTVPPGKARDALKVAESEVGSPYTQLGILLVKMKAERDEVAKIFEKGALADDPMSYYHLADFQAQYSTKWLDCKTKAAASGHPKAAYQVGKLYSLADKDVEMLQDGNVKRILKGFPSSKGPTTPRSRWWMAWEWFRVAQASKYPPAMLAVPELLWYKLDKKGVAIHEARYLESQHSEPEGGEKSENWKLYLDAVKKIKTLLNDEWLPEVKAGDWDMTLTPEDLALCTNLEPTYDPEEASLGRIGFFSYWLWRWRAVKEETLDWRRKRAGDGSPDAKE